MPEIRKKVRKLLIFNETMDDGRWGLIFQINYVVVPNPICHHPSKGSQGMN